LRGTWALGQRVGNTRFHSSRNLTSGESNGSPLVFPGDFSSSQKTSQRCSIRKNVLQQSSYEGIHVQLGYFGCQLSHVHIFQHAFSPHVLKSGYDIRTVQELPDHRDVKTSMIHTCVLKWGRRTFTVRWMSHSRRWC